MFKVGKFLEQVCLLACLYIVSYQLVIWGLGNQGMIAQRELLQVKQQMQTHYEQLEKLQRELRTLSGQINSNQSYITIEARSLGYYQKNDRLILVNTWSQTQPAPSPGDQMIPELKSVHFPRASIWLYALLLTGVSWLLIRLLYFGRTDVIPRMLGINELGEFSKVYHPKTIEKSTLNHNTRPSPQLSSNLQSEHVTPRSPAENSNRRRTGKPDLSAASHGLTINSANYSTEPLDHPNSSSILATETHFPSQSGGRENLSSLYRS